MHNRYNHAIMSRTQDSKEVIQQALLVPSGKVFFQFVLKVDFGAADPWQHLQ